MSPPPMIYHRQLHTLGCGSRRAPTESGACSTAQGERGLVTGGQTRGKGMRDGGESADRTAKMCYYDKGGGYGGRQAGLH